MGSFYVNYQVRAESAEAVLTMARRTCVGLAYVAPARNGWVAIYDEASDAQDEAMLYRIAHDLSEGLATTAFAFLVHDSDVLRYLLYERGALVADFNSWPDYHGSGDELENDGRQETSPRAHPDQLRLFDVGEPRQTPTPGNPEAVLRHCRPGTTAAEVRDLLRQDHWPAVEEALREGRWESCPGDARLVGLARLLGIDEDLVCLGFKYLEDRLDFEGLQTLRGVRKIRGKGKRRTPPVAEFLRSLRGAVAAGDIDAVRQLLAGGADPNTTGTAGDSLLFTAATGGHFEIALALLAAGARPSGGDAVTLLMRAVSFGRPDVVPALVAAGVDITAMGHFALFCAVTATSSDRPSRAEVEALEALLRAGADVHARDDRGMPPLMQAAVAGHRKFIEVLLRAGADVNAPDRSGRTALIWAILRQARSRCRHIVRLLLDAGADPDSCDGQGMTALMYAVVHPMKESRAAELVAELIRAGADVSVRTEAGDSALSLALGDRRYTVAGLLRAAGAKQQIR